ncbi:ribosome maturation factor RimM [Anaeromyxobacter paludicola]|uniref:Ribosome maturation factor RimM n=1 Tax=Anaeromyxobacter paludicola TaxID=2918171 RepID=A0ABN6N6A0_9BACT|nr:ribosome maturation factor RimM [Anaeromyxobacter paludicola]BDG07529.1 ribosome maturation factor RimM [Anaeromyxobacter paludicola]
MALVRIGKVVKAIGLKGFVGVGGSEGALAELPRVTLRAGGAERVLAVREARPQGRLWAVRLGDVAERSGAEALVGAEVLAERDDLGELEDGSHFWGDLEGMPVETAAGAPLGVVTGFYATGGVDVLVVKGDRERLIPLAPYVQVDGAARKVVVDPPEGLLEL